MSAVLEAKDEIRELMAAYAQALDACRFVDVAACFAADGEWTTDYGAARGRAEIEASGLFSDTAWILGASVKSLRLGLWRLP